VILVLRALGVGDLATAVPALRGLRRASGGDELRLAAPGWLAPLVDLVGAVDRLVPADGLAPLRWPPPQPRLAVNLHGRGPQSHHVLARANPDRLLAFACPAAGHHHGPAWRQDEHEVDRWCRLLGWYGIPADPADLALREPGCTDQPGCTIVHPGAKAAARRWPARRYATVAAALTDAGHRVMITGSAAERDLGALVAAGAGLPDEVVLAGRTDLGQLARLVAGARLVICGDTGVGHLATGYGVPSVVLFGPNPPHWWGPPPARPRHRALWHGPVRRTLVPEPSALHPSLARITVDEVLCAAGEVLRAGGRPSVPTAVSGGGERERDRSAGPVT
jgi:ADP-heptose:LPS heptosyltransferase